MKKIKGPIYERGFFLNILFKGPLIDINFNFEGGFIEHFFQRPSTNLLKNIFRGPSTNVVFIFILVKEGDFLQIISK